MKRQILLVILILLIGAFGLSAKDNSPFGSQYEDSNLAARLAIGGGGYGFSLYPGVEFIYTQLEIADGTMPVDLGVLAEGCFGYSSSFYIGAAGYATAHFGLADIDIEHVENLDIFLGVGFGFLGGPTFAGISGISYFLNPDMSIFLEYNYLSNSSGCLGVQMHL